MEISDLRTPLFPEGSVTPRFYCTVKKADLKKKLGKDTQNKDFKFGKGGSSILQKYKMPPTCIKKC